MAIVNFDYCEILRRAGAIEDAAQELDQLCRHSLATITESLEAAWQGEAAARFLRSCDACGEDLRAQSAALQELADRIRRAAWAIEEAERQAAQQVSTDQIR